MYSYGKKQLRQLPVIAALLPSLVANEISIVQALDRRIGAVFFLNLLYGSSKGAVTTQDTMISARTGHSRTVAGRMYASDRVVEEYIASSHGSVATLTGTVAYHPGVDIVHGTILIKDENGNEIGSDRAVPGTITGTNCTGTVTAAGVYSLSPVTSWDSSGITISYNYEYDKPQNPTTGEYTGVPEVDVSLVYETITARDFPLRARYSLGAEIDLQKAHGISLESELVKFLGGEVDNEFGLASLAIAA